MHRRANASAFSRAAAAALAVLIGVGPVATAAGAPALPSGRPRVIAIVSAGLPAYTRAEESAARVILAAFPDVQLITVHLDPGERGREQAREALAETPRMILAIGSRAAELAREAAPAVPLVYAMVLDPESIGLPGPGQAAVVPVTGVTMDVPAERQFELLREVLPSARRVGVLYNPLISGDAVRRAASAAKSQGMTLVPQAVRSESEVLAAASLLAPGVDALWAIADPTVLTAVNARALVLFSLRSRKPLLAMSEGFVRSGALAALAADPSEVGRRAGEMAVRLVRGEAPSALRPEPPPSLSLFVNRASAQHLGVSLTRTLLSRATGVYPKS